MGRKPVIAIITKNVVEFRKLKEQFTDLFQCVHLRDEREIHGIYLAGFIEGRITDRWTHGRLVEIAKQRLKNE